jgi:L-serine/L-threonine ammonia-lyase
MTIHIKTPLLQSLSVGRELQANVWLKMEAMQPCGSFKARGVGYACTEYVKEGATSFVSSSGGNAGLAVAYSGRKLGVPVTVVVPTTTKKTAIKLIEQEGASVIVKGDIWLQAHEHAMSLSNDKAIYIHPFDNPLLWTGHASMIDEVAEQDIKPDLIVLSVGGGGLLCGVIEGLQNNQWGDIPVLCVETQGADSLAQSFNSGTHSTLNSINSIATSLGATQIADQAFAHLAKANIYSQVVSDKAAVDSCLKFVEDHRVIVEPACGASLAAIYDGGELVKHKKNILVIVCGGVGASIEQLKQWNNDL